MTHECEVCSGCNQHVLHELNTTSSSRWSSNTPGQGNSIPLNAERVSCTEKTLKKTNGTDTLPRSSCFVQDPIVTNSSIVVSGSRHRVTATIARAVSPRHLYRSGCSKTLLVLAHYNSHFCACRSIFVSARIPCPTEGSRIRTPS